MGASQLVEANLAGGSRSGESSFPQRSSEWYLAKLESEALCLLPGDLPLRGAMRGMDDNGIAREMLAHFVDGESSPVAVDLDREFERNPELREYVGSRIEEEVAARSAEAEDIYAINGSVWVPQSAYGDSTAGLDQQRALGGTFFEYQVNGTADTGGIMVQTSVSDHYFWSPSEPHRPTQCLHEVGAELVAAGRATEFYQYGHGTLILNDPTTGSPMDPLEVARTRNE